MWRSSGGRSSPPIQPQTAEVLPARTSLENTGALCFGPAWMSSDSYIVSQASPFLRSLIQVPPHQMRPESRSEFARHQQRQRHGHRRRPVHRLPRSSDNADRSRSPLPNVREQQLTHSAPPNEDAEERKMLRPRPKRRCRNPYTCPHCAKRIAAHDRYASQLLTADSVIPSTASGPSWRSDDSPMFAALRAEEEPISRPLTQGSTPFSPESHERIVTAMRNSSFVISNSVNPPITIGTIPNSVITGSVSDAIRSEISNNRQDNVENVNPNIESVQTPSTEGTSPVPSCALLDGLVTGRRVNLPSAAGRLCGVSARSMPPSVRAQQVANRMIKHARCHKTPSGRALRCPDCGLLPVLPVTGQCGHTRCTKCIEEKAACPCGVPAPRNPHVNTLIQDLIEKIINNGVTPRAASAECEATDKEKEQRVIAGSSCPLSVKWYQRSGRMSRQRSTRSYQAEVAADAHQRHGPMSPEHRWKVARELYASGQYWEAAPRLARVAASSEPGARAARVLLAQTISNLSKGRHPRRVTRLLYRSLRQQSAASCFTTSDLECILCYHTYTRPVTTPCGHTYCRTCIERSLDYRKTCALCLRSLDDFDLAATRDTAFVCAALASIDALNPPLPPDPNVIPIFVCTVAYPAIPCPLFIFDPRYWLMIRRVLESGSRKFGMVAYERDRSYSDYGTVLEVCDCVHLEDGRSILSTVGVSRFRVIERDVRDGCDVARIQPLTDIIPTGELVIWDLRLMATQISYKALLWLDSMSKTVRSEIEAAFGQLPHFNHCEEDWWESPDGPAWLWWLIAILPLRSEIKVLILSTESLLKRMMAVSRTLHAMSHVALDASSSCELQTAAVNNAEEWLQRSS